MAETKGKTLEREYVIPLRNAWLKEPYYKRSRKAVKEIKIFIAKHMKVPERDVSKVKLDVYFNNDIWFRGRRKPPAKVKVKAIKSGDIVKVDFVEVPEHVSFLKKKHEKLHKKIEKKETSAEKPAETPAEEQTEEQKKDEKEKEQSVAQAREKQADQKAKEQKHTAKMKDKNQPKQRLVLDRH